MVPNADTQSREPSLRQTEEPETLDSHSVETNQPPPVRKLNGEVARQEEMAFVAGPHCEVWIGLWGKGGGVKDSTEGTGGGKVGGEGVEGENSDVEKVNPGLITSILLI